MSMVDLAAGVGVAEEAATGVAAEDQVKTVGVEERTRNTGQISAKHELKH